MTTKPKKPPMTSNEKSRGRYVAQQAAAIRDGYRSRSTALTLWAKNEANLIPHDDVVRRAEYDALRQWLGVVLDQVDYTSGACTVTEMVGAVLDKDVIKNARAALLLRVDGKQKENKGE